MPRTIWKGSLSFGLVNVPVGLYPATQDKSIHFNQFERGTSDRIRYKKVNERTGKEVRRPTSSRASTSAVANM
jgi:DNA end-binding protein Ku